MAFALLAAACSSSGRDFVRPTNGSLVLGATTPADVVASFGEPAVRANEAGDAIVVDAFETIKPRPAALKKATVKGEIERMRYSFTRATLVSLGEGVTAHIRLLDLAFWQGKLFAYHFSSSFGQDATDFDEKKVALLERNRTTISEVLNLFGPPGGQAIYPGVARQNTRLYVWQYAASGPRRGQVTLKRLELLFGPNERLDQIYLVSETKEAKQ